MSGMMAWAGALSGENVRDVLGPSFSYSFSCSCSCSGSSWIRPNFRGRNHEQEHEQEYDRRDTDGTAPVPPAANREQEYEPEQGRLDRPAGELEPPSMRLQTLFEARWIFFVLFLLGTLSLLLSFWLALLFLAIIGYTFVFFRDPERTVPSEPDIVVAAADGVVVEIADYEETEVVRQTMRRVAIF